MGIFQIGQAGGVALGEIQVGGIVAQTITPDQPSNPVGLRRSQLGWGQYSRKVWTRSYPWERPPSRPISDNNINIVITSVSGALIGKIRTDIQKSIVKSLTFTIDEQGSAEFQLVLATQPPFELLPMSIVTVNVGDSDFNWYKGILTNPQNQGTARNEQIFKGFGLRRYLERWVADTDFDAGTDITEVVSSLVENFIAPRGPIDFIPAKIDPNSGVILANKIELGKMPLRQVLDTLALMAQTSDFYYIWGVDGDGDFYWTKKLVNSLERTFWIGYNLNQFIPHTDYEKIINSWTVLRQEGRGSGGVGWAVGGIFTDTSSGKKYGENVDDYQVPGFFEQDDINLVGNALLAGSKDPIDSARTDGWLARNELEFLSEGNYRFILPQGDFAETVNDLDNASEFSVIGGGDLVLADDPTIFMFADGAVRLTFKDAINTRAELNLSLDGIIKEVRFYVRGSVNGDFITVGVGSTVWNQHTFKIDISLGGTFIPIVWDVSNLGIRKIGKLAFEVNSNQPSTTNVWVDKLDILFSGHKTYRMRKKRSTYRYEPGKNGVASEFGDLPASLPQFVAGLQAASKELRFQGEIR